MSYYSPNFYQNYMYGYQQPPQANPVQQTQSTQQFQPIGLNGKIVDSEDVVRATEVPLGGYGIFPKADFSEIYVKAWNNSNGTTNIFKFKPIIEEEKNSNSTVNAQQILEKINALEIKIDKMCGQTIQTEQQVTNVKKGVDASAY